MRRFTYFTATLLVFALLIVGFFSLRGRQAAARRLEQWQFEHDEDAIPPVFVQEFDWQRADLTLIEFADLLALKSGLVVELDEDSFGATGSRNLLFRDIVIRVPEGRFALDVLLRMVLMPKRLCSDLRGQKLLIALPVNAAGRTRLRTAVYPLPLPERRELDEAYWARIVAANIDGHVEAVPGAVIVVANAAGQRRARLVIETIRGLNAATTSPVVIPPARVSLAERRILAALDEPANLDVVEMPLKDVVLYLVERHGIPLILMADKLDEASVGLDVPITKSFKDISLRSVLRLMLKDLELTYCLRDEALLLTTPEDAESQERTVAYPVQDLTKDADGFFDVDSLAELVPACIKPDAWGDGNGGGPTALSDGWLLVEQTDYVHEQVAALLAVMRRNLASEDHAATQPINPWTEVESKLRAALEQPIDLDFQNVPLKDVVIHLQELLGIPIVLSLKKLEEAAVSADTPITHKLAKKSARDHLQLLLKQVALDFLVRDEVLQITTPEDVEFQLDTRIYDTRQLIAATGISADDLVNLIESSVQPQSWDSSGGPGSVKPFRNLLIVSHIERVHEEIEKLLAKLSKRTSTSNPAPASQKNQ